MVGCRGPAEVHVVHSLWLGCGGLGGGRRGEGCGEREALVRGVRGMSVWWELCCVGKGKEGCN